MSLTSENLVNHLQSLRLELDQLVTIDCPYPVAEQRSIAERMTVIGDSANHVTTGISRHSTILLGAIKGEWFVPAEVTATYNRILYLHGSSFALTGLRPRLGFAGRLAAMSNAEVLALDYRQRPAFSYSALLADCLAAYTWMLVNGAHENSSALNAYIVGEGEGGTLALATMLAVNNRELKPPTAVVALSPVTDWTGGSPSWVSLSHTDPYLSRPIVFDYATRYLGNNYNGQDPMISPLFGNLESLPPLLLQVGEREILLDDSKRFAKKVIDAGGRASLHIFNDMPHAFQLFAPFLHEATVALQQIADFMRHCATGSGKSCKILFLPSADPNGPQKRVFSRCRHE